MTPNPEPILVVGAGPTGLMMAGELARHGVPFRIVDRAPGLQEESRAIAVQARTIECLDAIGIAEDLITRGVRIHHLRFMIDGDDVGQIHFGGLPSRFNFVLSVPQAETVRLLSTRLQDTPIEWNAEVADVIQRTDSARVLFKDGSEGFFSYVIGCDGAHSQVRQTTGVAFQGEDYRESFVLADIDVDWQVDRDEAVIMIAESGLLLVFPLPGGGSRIVASVDTEPGEKPAAPSLDDLMDIFAERSAIHAELSNLTWSSGFQIHRRMVAHLRQGRCFLVGDAAHIHSPAGGQGMNTGLQDAMNLAWKLAFVEKGWASPQLLDSFEQERLPVERDVLQLSDMLTKNITVKNETLRWLRRHIWPLLIGRSAIQARIRDRAAELNVNYRGAPLSVGNYAGDWAGISNLPGDAMHVLVGGPLDVIPVPWRDRLELRAADSSNGEAIREPSPLAAEGRVRAATMLVRPDGYIGATSNFDEYFRRLASAEEITTTEPINPQVSMR